MVYTSHGQIITSLPPTPYIKMLDWGFLTSLLQVFIVILFHTFLNFYYRTNRSVAKRIPKNSMKCSKEDETRNRLAAECWMKRMRYIIPIIYLIMFSSYLWVIHHSWMKQLSLVLVRHHASYSHCELFVFVTHGLKKQVTHYKFIDNSQILTSAIHLIIVLRSWYPTIS